MAQRLFMLSSNSEIKSTMDLNVFKEIKNVRRKRQDGDENQSRKSITTCEQYISLNEIIHNLHKDIKGTFLI
jgi:hypothetical protein